MTVFVAASYALSRMRATLFRYFSVIPAVEQWAPVKLCGVVSARQGDHPVPHWAVELSSCHMSVYCFRRHIRFFHRAKIKTYFRTED